MKWLYFHHRFTGSLDDLAVWMRGDDRRKCWDVVSIYTQPSQNVTVDPRPTHDILYRVSEKLYEEWDADDWHRTHGDF